MKIIALAVLAVASGGISRAVADIATPQFAIYYSFDRAPDPQLFSEMQAEFTRIVAPVGLPVAWRKIGVDKAAEFAEIFVFRFHGSCSANSTDAIEPPLTRDERSLAESSVSDGHVLPFAEVQCDLVRRYLSPSIRGKTNAYSVLARAVARVAAHEVFHMITGSVAHRAHGIAQGEYSLRNLTSTQFAFGRDETEWLRAKTAAHLQHPSI